MSSQSSNFAPAILNSATVFPSREIAKRVSFFPPSLWVQSTFVCCRLATTPELSVILGLSILPVWTTSGAPSQEAHAPQSSRNANFDWLKRILLLGCLRISDGETGSSIQNKNDRSGRAWHDLR